MSVKQSKRGYLRELYDSFRVKDCTFTEFKRRYIAAIDPRGIRRDMLGIMDQVHRGKRLRKNLDEAQRL